MLKKVELVEPEDRGEDPGACGRGVQGVNEGEFLFTDCKRLFYAEAGRTAASTPSPAAIWWRHSGNFLYYAALNIRDW